jgi:eukaryotic-like serine/threonine-protein kinase
MSGCPSEETLDAFAEGRLDAAPRQALEAHLDGCGGCGQLIACVFSRSVGRGTAEGRLLPTAPTTPLRGFALARAEGDKFGRYVILGGMGIGGMGAVYAAYDTALERKVAVTRQGHGATSRQDHGAR